jgi:hypothetical protein
MDRHVVWEIVWRPGFEHVALRIDPHGLAADGIAVAIADPVPFRIRYEIRCDEATRVRAVSVHDLDRPDRVVRLAADGAGHWTGVDGSPMPALAGCLDVDVAAMTFTNTLPIRRLGLDVGQSAELAMAYVALPDLSVQPTRQRYTCLARTPSSARYRYEGLGTGFVAELPTDADGVVVDYPGLSRRVWPRA